MKKLFLPLLLALVLSGTPALADSFQKGQISSGVSTGTSSQSVNGVVGDCLSIKPIGSDTPIFNLSCIGNLGIAGAYSPASGGSTSYIRLYDALGPTGQGDAPLSNVTYPQPYNHPGLIPKGMSIGHLSVVCLPYNTTDTGGSNTWYNPLDSTGLGGGTINFAVASSTYPITAPHVIGSVVLPSSPQGGPWVSAVTTALGSPYIVGQSDSIVTSVTSTSTTASQTLYSCTPFVGS